MEFRHVKRFLAVGLVAMIMLGMPIEASAAGLKDIFDAKYYADSYPDLKAAFGYNEKALYNHFLKYGLKEGRNMNPVLDVVSYRKAYKDLDDAFGENWDAYVEHFLTYGVKEKNRRKGVLMDPLAYSEAYSDVKNVYGNDLLAIIKHYEEHGYEEKRTEGTAKGHSDIAQAKAAEQPRQAASGSAPSVNKPAVQPQAPVSEEFFRGDAHTTYEYDAAGNVIKETYVSRYFSETILYTYNDNNDIIGVWCYDRDGKLKYYYLTSYNDQGQAIKSTDYDKDGNVTAYSLIEWNADSTESKSVHHGSDDSQKGYSLRKHDSAKNIIQNNEYSNEGNLISSYTATYNAKKKWISYSTCDYDSDGNVTYLYSEQNSFYTNGKYKERSMSWLDWKMVETYNEDGYLIYSDSDFGDSIGKMTYEYYPDGPVKQSVSQCTYIEDNRVTIEVVEYNTSGIPVKSTYKATEADGTTYENLSVYDERGRVIHCEESDEYVTDYIYYENGELKQSTMVSTDSTQIQSFYESGAWEKDDVIFSDGSKRCDTYRDAGRYIDPVEDYEELSRYRLTSYREGKAYLGHLNEDGEFVYDDDYYWYQNETVYSEDGSCVVNETRSYSDGRVEKKTLYYDANGQQIE